MSIESKLVRPQDLTRTLASIRRKLKRSGGKLVMTNGCFDLLHRGHVEYLEAAKKQGAILVVALNSDASVKRLKGPTRPIVPLADRARVVAALAAVDVVTWFHTTSVAPLVKSIRPDVLVKGGDYKPHEIVGFETVLEYGGKVVPLKLVPRRSSSALIRRIEGT